ncbi:MAG: hypothetical protein OXB88_01510 [Bacteriovoracales bacterium]|nr:hypothetical protein [Bacteriovoracales bacterium]
MSDKKTMTEEDFYKITPKIEKILHNAWEEEKSSRKDEAPSSEEKNDIWSALPTIDSKVAVVFAVKVEKETKLKVSEEMIRKGGYDSITELVRDFLTKLHKKYVEKVKAISGKIKSRKRRRRGG